MRLSIFNQSDIQISFRIVRNEVVIYWLKGFRGELGHYKVLCWYSHESEASNFYITQFVEKSKFVPYMEKFLIDNWDLNEQNKEIEILRQVVPLS